MVDAKSPYNAIMGRTWLHSMEAVPSTHHQKLRFPLRVADGSFKMVIVRGNQQMTKECLMAVVPGDTEQ